MNVKVFSVRLDETFGAIRTGGTPGYQPGSEYLESMIQSFLDEHPQIEVVSVQFSGLAIIPRTAAWGTTNVPIEWEMEQTVIIFYRDGV